MKNAIVKKILSAAAAVSLIASAAAFSAHAASDGTFEYGTKDPFGMEYGAIVITKYLGSDSNIVFPATLDEQPVEYVFLEFDKDVSLEFSEGFQSLPYMNFIHIPKDGKDDRGRVISVKLPESLTTLKTEKLGGTFEGYKNLESINLPEGLYEIPDDTFRDCEKLKSIEIPKNVEIIKGDAFNNCISLETVVMTGGVTTIKERAFNYCTGLKTITLPNTLKEIVGKSVFAHCDSLQTVNYMGTEEEFDQITMKPDVKAFLKPKINYVSADTTFTINSSGEVVQSSSSNLTLIIILCVGGVVLVALLIVIVAFISKKKKQ